MVVGSKLNCCIQKERPEFHMGVELPVNDPGHRCLPTEWNKGKMSVYPTLVP